MHFQELSTENSEITINLAILNQLLTHLLPVSTSSLPIKPDCYMSPLLVVSHYLELDDR